MIEFTCGECGRVYSVPDAAAGKKAKCKCGAALLVPSGRSPDVFTAQTSQDEPPTPEPCATAGDSVAPPSPAAPDSSASVPSVAAPHGSSEPHPAPPDAPPPTPPLPSFAPPAPAKQTPGGPKLPMRTRRLIADAAEMAKAFADFPMIKLKATTGAPPEVYQIEYSLRGLERGKKREPVSRDHHVAEIQLTSDYPRLGPKCRMLTPIFHPNIDPATICVGDHWTAGERLADLVVRIGEMIAYQAYNIKSPLDAEAAMWADLNREKLPVDTRNLYPPQLDE